MNESMKINFSNYKTIQNLSGKCKNYTYLTPVHENVLSYYRKARIFEKDGVKILVSYETPIALIADGVVFKLQENSEETLSSTTMRHLREFLLQNGKEKITKGEWRKVSAIN